MPSVTIGNPELSPFRAKNFDFCPRVVFRGRWPVVGRGVQEGRVELPADRCRTAATLQELLPPDQYAATLETQTPQQIAWIIGGGSGGAPGLYGVRQFQDSPGGDIEGYELSYQQDFTFLPGFWKNFGVQANYTHLTSELQYIVDPGNTLVTPDHAGASAGHAAWPVHRRVAGVGELHAVLRDAEVERARFVGLSFGVREPVSDCRWHLRSRRLRRAARERLPRQPGHAQHRCEGDLAGDGVSCRSSIEGLNLTNQTEDRWAYQDEPLVTQYSSTGRRSSRASV